MAGENRAGAEDAIFHLATTPPPEPEWTDKRSPTASLRSPATEGVAVVRNGRQRVDLDDDRDDGTFCSTRASKGCQHNGRYPIPEQLSARATEMCGGNCRSIQSF